MLLFSQFWCIFVYVLLISVEIAKFVLIYISLSSMLLVNGMSAACDEFLKVPCC